MQHSRNDEEVLKILAEYKWDRKYVCQKCGSDGYKKGKSPFSKRCANKKCGYDESVQMFTALEGVRIPLEKVFNILLNVLDSTCDDREIKTISVEPEKKILRENRDVEDNFNLGESLSIKEVLLKYRKGDYSAQKTERLLVGELADRKLTVSRLARKFELEENSVSKLFEKIDSRLPVNEFESFTSPLERLQEFIHRKSLDYLLGFVMFPLREEGWKNGEIKKDNIWYALSPPHAMSKHVIWQVVEVNFYRRNDKGELETFYNKEDEPEYKVPGTSAIVI